MSNRSLTLAALVLAGLIALLGLVGAQRLGWLATPELPSWEFKNHLCDCRRGTQAILRPAVLSQESLRYWFLQCVTEPDRANPGVKGPVGGYPHWAATVEIQRPPDEGFYLEPNNNLALFAFRQLGALTHTESLEEIGLVEEKGGAGRSRTLLCARFSTPTKASIRYFYDPAAGEPESGLGWERVERHAETQASEVFYLSAGPFREPPGGK